MEIVINKPGQWSTSDDMDHADYASAAAWCDYCNTVAMVKALHAEHGIKPLQSATSWLRFNHVDQNLSRINQCAQ